MSNMELRNILVIVERIYFSQELPLFAWNSALQCNWNHSDCNTMTVIVVCHMFFAYLAPVPEAFLLK